MGLVTLVNPCSRCPRQTPERLAVALSGSPQPAVRRLVFLGRRAVRAATPHAGGLVADAALAKLQVGKPHTLYTETALRHCMRVLTCQAFGKQLGGGRRLAVQPGAEPCQCGKRHEHISG